MGAVTTNPDLLLARRAAAGQTEAWEELIALLGRKIYNLAFQFAGRSADAEDLTQEIFLRLYRNLGKYRGEVPLVAWAMRLSRNLCIDEYRRNRRQGYWTTTSEEILDQLPSDDDPHARATRRQRLESIHRALATMPEALAEVVLLRDLQGWTFEETATYLGIPMGTLKSRIFRARQALTEILDAGRPTPAAEGAS